MGTSCRYRYIHFFRHLDPPNRHPTYRLHWRSHPHVTPAHIQRTFHAGNTWAPPSNHGNNEIYQPSCQAYDSRFDFPSPTTIDELFQLEGGAMWSSSHDCNSSGRLNPPYVDPKPRSHVSPLERISPDCQWLGPQHGARGFILKISCSFRAGITTSSTL